VLAPQLKEKAAEFPRRLHRGVGLNQLFDQSISELSSNLPSSFKLLTIGMMKPEEVRIFLIYATGQGSVFLTMPPDIREKFTRTIVAAPKHVRKYIERYTKIVSLCVV
jgi:hypothetical protein